MLDDWTAIYRCRACTLVFDVQVPRRLVDAGQTLTVQCDCGSYDVEPRDA